LILIERNMVFEVQDGGLEAVSPPIITGRGVTSNNSENDRTALDKKNSGKADFLDLNRTAAGAGAALVAELLEIITAAEARKRRRGNKLRAKLSTAVAALIAGILTANLLRGVAVFHPMSPGSFTGTIGYRTAKFVLTALMDAGLLLQRPGIRYLRDFGEHGMLAGGLATRFAATPLLLAMAERHGITGETVPAAFPRHYPARAARIVHPIKITALETRAGGVRRRGGRPLLPVPKTKQARELAGWVKLANRTLAAVRWAGCQPPQMYRSFTEDFTLVGRWIVAGATPIQLMSPAARLAVTINGEAVAEVDVTGSHLAILAALSGVNLLPADPYAFPGYKREAGKLAVVASLGIGRLPGRWPRKMRAENPALAEVNLARLTAKLAEAYPFLSHAADILKVPRRLVGHRLQAIEAEALTAAMLPLWRDGVPVVPVHDSIICPARAVEWVEASIIAAYAARCGASIRVTRHGG